MTEKHLSHIPLMGFGTLLCISSFIGVLYMSDPFADGMMAYGFFYSSLFLSVVGLTTIVGLLVRQKIGKGLYINNLAVSFRQAILIAILVVGSLLLQSYDILFWWVELSFILFLVFFELFLNL